MNGLISAVYSLLKNRGTFFQEFKESGTFIAPKTGWYEIDGCGGGASGALSQSYSGGAGAGCQSYRVYLIKGESVPVTIGAGGVWVSGETIAPGGDTIFGPTSLGFRIILPGAPGILGGLNRTGPSSTGYPWRADACPVGFLFTGACGAVSQPPGSSNFKSGITAGTSPAYYGGAGGFFGPGGDGNNSGKGQSAAANSGAGGGSGSTGGGNGGSGRIRIREAC